MTREEMIERLERVRARMARFVSYNPFRPSQAALDDLDAVIDALRAGSPTPERTATQGFAGLLHRSPPSLWHRVNRRIWNRLRSGRARALPQEVSRERGAPVRTAFWRAPLTSPPRFGRWPIMNPTSLFHPLR